MIQNYLIRREMAKKISAADRGSAAVSSQFHIVLHKSYCYAKFQGCKSYLDRDQATYFLQKKSLSFWKIKSVKCKN